jgi:hypothetical protein
MAKTVFQVLINAINAHRNAVVDSLASGGAKEYAEYRELCGLIRGLETAQREIQDLSRHYMENDDD